MTTVGPMEAALQDQLPEEFSPDDPRFNEVAALVVDGATADVKQPDIALPEDTTVVLPAGIVAYTGSIIDTVEVRELTGEDEEALARFRNITPVAFMGEILMRGIESVGSAHEKPDKGLISAMLIGDRDAVLLGVRRVTFGNSINFTGVICPSCRREFDIKVGIDEIPIVQLKGAREVRVKLRKGGEIVLRYPTQGDALEVFANDTMTAVERNTAVIAHCMTEFRGKGPEDIAFEREDIARRLGAADRANILKVIAERRPGPRIEEVKANCPACNFEAPVDIDLVDIFRS